MSYFGGIFFLILTLNFSPSFAQTVQVPENCINRVSPCLIHTEDRSFTFKQDGQRVKILNGTVLKIETDEKNINFEVIEGRISLDQEKKSEKVLSVNNKAISSGRLLANRFTNQLAILDLKDFILSEYLVIPGSLSPKQIKSDFINKNDFVKFTKYYFESVGNYKNFLTSEAQNWKNEFKKQNNSQTKVLLRTIASEQEKAKLEAQKSSVKSREAKKARDTFFYRTFER